MLGGRSRPHSRVGCEVARPEQEQKLPSPDRPGDVLLELSGASPPDRNKPDLEDLTIFRSRSQDLAASGFWADARRQDTGSRLASCCVIVVASDYVRCLVPRSLRSASSTLLGLAPTPASSLTARWLFRGLAHPPVSWLPLP